MLFSCMKTKMETEFVIALSTTSLSFSSALHKILSRTEGTIVYSPINIHGCLSLIYQGVDGYTAEALGNVLCLPNKNMLAKGYQNLLSILYHEKNVKLHIANKIYLRQNFRLKQNFDFTGRNYFGCGIELINFLAEQEAVEEINHWVEHQTDRKIKAIVKIDDINDSTCLVLVNAVYFKGDWLYRFEMSNTKKQNFYINESEIVECDMMHTENIFGYNYCKDLDAQILNLPYKNQKFNLIIILPRCKEGIIDLARKFKSNTILEICKYLCLTHVKVSLPKFKFEITTNLRSALTEMGLGVLFSNAADFSNMSDNCTGLRVSKVVQKVLIEISEEGAQAAPIIENQDEFVCGITTVPPKLFMADHPFLFSVLYHENRMVYPLLLGTCKSPAT